MSVAPAFRPQFWARFSLVAVMLFCSIGAVRGQVRSAPPWNSGVYSYDGSGQLRAIGGNPYTYDVLGRLTSGAANGKTQSYRYDGFGNLIEIATDGAPTRAMPVDRATNRIQTNATYDAAGNQTSENGQPLRIYDAFNSMTAGSNGAQYIYDANDERIAITNAARTEWRWTVRDPSARAIREFTETGPAGGVMTWKWEKDYVYRGGVLLGAYVNENGQVKRLHYHLDHLGTPRLTTEAVSSGTAVGRLELNDFPFGEEAAFVTGNTETRHFTGHERDYNGGTAVENKNYLDYMHARYYSPITARFLSLDPQRNGKPARPQSWNRYSYAMNNPLMLVDPDGKDVIVAPEMQAFVQHGRENSVTFAEMYERAAKDPRVRWEIKGDWNAKPGTRARTPLQIQIGSDGIVASISGVSLVPQKNGPAVKTALIAHEGAHVMEVLDTNKSLKARHDAKEPGVRNNGVGYESAYAEQVEKQVASELKSGVKVIPVHKSVSELMKKAPGTTNP